MDEKDKITYFAETDSRNKRVKFGIKAEDRLRHIYSIGKTGMGKSTMLENMAIQDIQNGEGVAFLDPHGKTADLLLDYIPEHRIKDVIYFAPFDTEFPISFNVMEDVGPERRHLVVSGLMSAFEKIWEDQWSSRMAYILQNTLAALLEYPGATMLSINRMLTDKAYRNKVVDNVKDPTTKAFWTEEFAKYTDKYAAEATPAIQNKVGQFVSNPLIRNIIGQPKSSFDVRKIMDEKKILIVNLSKGLVGEGNANLLGAMLVTKIYLAAMSRADADPKELKKLPNFYLYVDEFQSFANKSFADILSEARKYKLSLNITHQYIEQMAEEVRAAVFGNVGTMITFRVGSYDAEVLEKEFAPTFTMEDIVNLGFVQVYLKLMINGVASQPFSATTLPPFPKPEISFRDKALEMSRKNYTSPKAEVERVIKEWHLPDSLIAKPLRVGEPEKIEGRNMKHEIRREEKPTETKKEIRYEQNKPKEIKAEPKKENNFLAKAIEEAVKQKPAASSKQPVAREEKRDEIKSEQKKETVSLQELRYGEKNKNKEPTIENVSALREAIQKAKSLELKAESKKEEKKEEVKKTEKTKEVPEETLRKILKGE
ncbi:MAG: type IV secretion system DNA-binding domain-containing protein [Patescibacteria group bacterium]